MCGIVGVTGHVPLPAVRAASLRALGHRGPDSAGDIVLSSRNTDLWLGHTRLSILDLSEAGHQPMSSRDSRWWVTFNGEIYNHDELRDDLAVSWRGYSDTESVVEALAAWGLGRTLARLNGMFAFAAVDMEAGAVYLARDPLGVKPLYYARTSKDVCFASEIKTLLGLCDRTCSLDPDALQTFLSLRFVPSPHTLLDGIQRVPPGHYVRIDVGSGGTKLHSYMEPTIARFPGSAEDAVEQYGELMRQVVNRQMLSDVPVGVLLSGGVDSAFVAAIAAERSADTPCFSVGFGPDFPECELADAAQSARVLGLKVHQVLVTHDDLWCAFESCVAAVEEPLGTASMLPMWHLAKRAGEHVKVVLTGQGSDEPWGGYRRYQAELWRDLPLTRMMAKSALPMLEAMPGVPEYVLRAVNGMPISDMASRFEREYSLFADSERSALTGATDCGRAVERISYWLDWSAGQAGANGAERMMSIDSRMGLSDDLLLYGDKITMAHSLEARVPMLDIELVRFVESLPRSYRLSLRRGKIVHKLAAERYLPAEIVHRRKKAFPMPFGEWIRTVWKDRAAAVLFRHDAPHLAWLSASGIRRLWEEHQRGARDRSRQIFALLAFAFWCRTMEPFLESRSARSEAMGKARAA